MRLTTATAVPLALALLGAGFAAGWAARGPKPVAGPDPAAYQQRREGRLRHVNPLLECDLAEDVLRNRELVPFKERVAALLAAQRGPRGTGAVSVYFRELNDGIWFAVGETERFIPASLRKVPLLIALLKEAERPGGEALLDRPVAAELSRDYNADQNVRPSERLFPGRRYPVRELISRMIVHSDNNAFMLLTRVVDPVQLDEVYALLRMQAPRTPGDDQYLSVQTYASFFRILYNATYLGREHSEWALTLLAASTWRDGLVAAVPAGVEVAHKFGEKADARDGTVQLHDCGIVYHPANPYLLCVMSRGPDFAVLDDAIVAVSRLVWQEVEAQVAAGRQATPARR
jgi:beta-lactamase class A